MPHKDIEKRKEWRRKYYVENRERIQAYQRKWVEMHKEACLARQASYRERNREQIRERLRNNPNKRLYAIKNSERIATINRSLRQKALDLFGRKCQVCGFPKGRLSFHHKWYTPEEAFKHNQSYWKQVRNLQAVLKEPERFMLLCTRCHSIVTLFQLKPYLIERILQVVSESYLPSEAWLDTLAKPVRKK